VEEALQAATGEDFRPFEELVEALAEPFEERPRMERFGIPARPEQCVLQTFCGT